MSYAANWQGRKMQACLACKYWNYDPDENKEWSAWLQTRPDFSCNQWEGRADAELTFAMVESLMEEMKNTDAYRQYIESEINLRMEGGSLSRRQPIGLFDPDTMRFRE